MIICKKCGSIASYNSYFDSYICGHCHTKNYPIVQETRPCGKCKCFLKQYEFSTCRKKLMVVFEDMYVSYKRMMVHVLNKENCE